MVDIGGRDTEAIVAELARRLEARRWRLAAAESCTGGLIAAACTARPGSSTWFECGFVSYSNASKTELLGVAAAQIGEHGAVSGPVACAMAEGALRRAATELAVAVTGIAGPSGAVPGKPVGTVWIATALRGGPTQARAWQFAGDRAAVRDQSVVQALAMLLERLPEPDARGLS